MSSAESTADEFLAAHATATALSSLPQEAMTRETVAITVNDEGDQQSIRFIAWLCDFEMHGAEPPYPEQWQVIVYVDDGYAEHLREMLPFTPVAMRAIPASGIPRTIP